MNHCLEYPTGERACPAPEAPIAPAGFTSDGEGAVPAGAAGEGEGCAPNATVAPAAVKGRILLLEDDPAFKDVIRDFLLESGYSVVQAQNGVDGIREIMSGEFVLILCDMLMPTMPGEMFYRAVGQIRPQLCNRFIFMTGYRNDATSNEFIEKHGAYVLRKPFRLNDLLDSIAMIEVLSGFQSVFEGELPPPAQPRQPSTPAPIPEPAALPRELPEPEVAAAAFDPYPRRPFVVVHRPPATGVSAGFVFAGLTVIVLTILLGGQYVGARDRFAAATAERAALQAEWADISERLDTAVAANADADLAANQLARLSADRTQPRWSWALRSLIPPGDAMIAIDTIHAHAHADDPGACQIIVQGAAEGAIPRLVADRFLQALELELKKGANGRTVSTRFDHLDEAAETLPDGKGAAFVLTADVDPRQESTPTSQEER